MPKNKGGKAHAFTLFVLQVTPRCQLAFISRGTVVAFRIGCQVFPFRRNNFPARYGNIPKHPGFVVPLPIGPVWTFPLRPALIEQWGDVS